MNSEKLFSNSFSIRRTLKGEKKKKERKIERENSLLLNVNQLIGEFPASASDPEGVARGFVRSALPLTSIPPRRNERATQERKPGIEKACTR